MGAPTYGIPQVSISQIPLLLSEAGISVVRQERQPQDPEFDHGSISFLCSSDSETVTIVILLGQDKIAQSLYGKKNATLLVLHGKRGTNLFEMVKTLLVRLGLLGAKKQGKLRSGPASTR